MEEKDSNKLLPAAWGKGNWEWWEDRIGRTDHEDVGRTKRHRVAVWKYRTRE